MLAIIMCDEQLPNTEFVQDHWFTGLISSIVLAEAFALLCGMLVAFPQGIVLMDTIVPCLAETLGSDR